MPEEIPMPSTVDSRLPLPESFVLFPSFRATVVEYLFFFSDTGVRPDVRTRGNTCFGVYDFFCRSSLTFPVLNCFSRVLFPVTT